MERGGSPAAFPAIEDKVRQTPFPGGIGAVAGAETLIQNLRASMRPALGGVHRSQFYFDSLQRILWKSV